MSAPGTLRLALLGHPVAHSRSPELHAAFGRQLGLAVDYQLIDVPSPTDGARALGRALTAFVAAGGGGANVTLPFKQDALKLCATLGPEAKRAGAVNTIVVEAAGRLRGEQTDGAGLCRDLGANHGIALGGLRVALLGASGAARGVAAALEGAGIAALAIAARDAGRAAALARDFPSAAVGGYAALADGRYDLVINATSASLKDELPPLPERVLAPGGVAYDLCYAAAPTPFQRWATAAGARLALDGWGMLVEQGALSFALWTGRHPDTAPLLAAR